MSNKILAFAAIVAIIIASSVSANLVSKISGGNTAEVGQFPYMVYFTSPSVTTYQVLCSGIIIDPSWILTQAACITLGNLQLPDVVAVAGTANLTQAGTRFGIRNWTTHPDYNPFTEEDGVGLIQLSTRIQPTPMIQVISIDSGEVAEGDSCTVIGWGSLDSDVPNSNALSFLENPVIPLDDCLERWDQYIGDYYLGNKSVCTYSGLVGEGATDGDAGGAVVSDGNLTGLVYLGVPGIYGVPIVSLRLAHYLDWINEQIAAGF